MRPGGDGLGTRLLLLNPLYGSTCATPQLLLLWLLLVTVYRSLLMETIGDPGAVLWQLKDDRNRKKFRGKMLPLRFSRIYVKKTSRVKSRVICI